MMLYHLASDPASCMGSSNMVHNFREEKRRTHHRKASQRRLKMNESRWIKALLAGVFFVMTTGIHAGDMLPEWRIGSWWDFTTVMDVHIQETGSPEYTDMIITDSQTRHVLQSIETKTLTHGSQLIYDAYILPFTGVVNATGESYVVDPYPMTLPMEIRNADLTGEWWVDTETLGTVYQLRSIDGPLWANIPIFGWQEIGTIAITMHEEYEPARDNVNFPIAVGNTWQNVFTLYTFGEYVVDAEVFGTPIYEEGTFDESVDVILDMFVPNQELFGGYLAYRIEGENTVSTGLTLSYYAPDPRTLIYDYLENFVSEGSVQINSYERIMDAFFLKPGPEPTPTVTPMPTVTPIPTDTPIPTHTPDCIHHGDVTLDGAVTAGDAQLAFMIALGQYSPSYEEECAADCNGDGMVSAGDAQLIFLTALGSASCVDPIP